MRRPKSPAIIIVLLSMLVVAAIAMAYILAHARSAWKSLPQALSTAVSQQVNGKFSVGKVDVSVGGVVFRNVSLTSDEDGSKPVLDAEAVKVGFGLPDLISNRKDPVRAISSVEIIRPNITLDRAADGRWNVADLFKPSSGQSQFKGRVIIKSGTITIVDRKTPGRPEKNGLSNVGGIIDFADVPVADYRLTAEGADGRVGKISVKGRYNFENESFDADFEGLSADISYWTRYPSSLKFMDVSSGSADVRMRLTMEGEGKPFRYSAEFQVTDASVQLKKMQKPATQVGGTVKLENDQVTLSLRARLGSTPFLISGRVIGLKGSKLALDLQSDRANFQEISRLVSISVPKGVVLPTSGRALVSVSGPSKRPTAVFKLDGPTFAYNNFAFTSVHAEGGYSAQHAEIRSAVGQAYGGSFEAYGEFGWGPREGISLHGSASGVRLSRLPSLKGRGVDAVTSGHFDLEWGKSSGMGTYRGTLTDGVVQGQEFSKGAIAVSYDGSNMHLDEVSAEMLGGKVAASGDVLPGGDLDLEVSGAGINLAAVMAGAWMPPSPSGNAGENTRASATVGRLQFSGNLQGAPESPTFDGQVEAYGVMSNGISAERISADLEATRRRIRLRSLEISDPAGQVTASGDIVNPFSMAPQLDLSLSIEALDIERWAISAELPFEVSGMVSAEMKVTKTLFKPDIEGTVHVDKGQFAEMPLDSADMRIAYHDSLLALTGFEARDGGGVISADGSMNLVDGGIHLTFDARSIPIADLAGSMRQYALLSGDLNARGELSGALTEAVLSATVSSDNPGINGQSFDKFEANLTWTSDKLSVSRATLTDGATDYTLSGLSYLWDDRKADLSAEVTGASIEKLISLAEKGPKSDSTASLKGYLASIPRPCRGTLDVSVTGSINFASLKPVPDLQFKGTVDNVTVGLGDINSIRLEGGWQGDVVKVSKLEVLDGETFLTAGGVFGPNGEIDLDAKARGLDLQSASEWLKLDQNISGAADVIIIAKGTAKSPSVQVDLDIRNPVIESMKFDSLSATLSSVPVGDSSESRINIDDLTIVLGESQMSASGFIPVDWEHHSIPRDRELLVEMLLDDGSLKLLSAFAGEAVQGEAGGDLSGKLSYGGTIDAPILWGGLKWRGGSVRLAALNKPFDQIAADVTLSGHTLSIDSLTGESAGGGSFAVSGPIDLIGMKPNLDLSLSTSGLRIAGKDISGRYGETLDVAFDSNLELTGDWLRPLIAGEIGIPEGSVELGSSDGNRKPAGTKLDPKLDLKVSIGRGMRLKTALLETALPGSLSVGGSLSEPIVDGLVNLADGRITFPMSSFRILPGSDMQVRMSPGQPALVLVDIQARGNVVDISPLGKRTKYSVTMQATGLLDRLHPAFTSSPLGLSEQRMVALVTGQYHFEQILKGNSDQDIGKELSGLFSSAMMPAVFGPIEQALQEAFGLDEFAVDMNYQEPVQLSIGSQLGRNTYLSYSAALGARPDYADSRYELKLSYRVRNNLEFSIQTDENKMLGISAEGKIRF